MCCIDRLKSQPIAAPELTPESVLFSAIVGNHEANSYPLGQQLPGRHQPLSLFNELKRRNVLRVTAAYVVVAWLLIQVAETIFPLFGFDDTPARIVVVVLAIGFIPAMVFAWAFELTPEGLKKEKDVDRAQSITQHTGKRLDCIVMVLLALALG